MGSRQRADKLLAANGDYRRDKDQYFNNVVLKSVSFTIDWTDFNNHC